MASRLLLSGRSNTLFSPLIDVVANGMAAMFIILVVYMAMFKTRQSVPPITFLEVDTPPVVCGVPYAFAPPVAGGVKERLFSLSKGNLPNALKLHESTGTIFGIPDCSNRSNKVESMSAVVAVKSGGSEASRELLFKIHPGAIPYDPNKKLDIQTKTELLPSARVGTAYSLPLGGVGGAQPFYRWRLVKGEIPGITIGETDGILRGTPTRAGLYNLDVRLDHVHGRFEHQGVQIAWEGAQQTRSYLMEVLAESKPRVVLPMGRVGETYYGIGALTNRATGESIQVTLGESGLSIDADGVVHGKPLKEGKHVAKYKVVKDGRTVTEGTSDFTVLPGRHKSELRTSTYHAIAGSSFSMPISVFGLREPIAISVSNLPGWARIEDRSIVGTAPIPGAYEFKVSASDSIGGTVSGNATLVVSAPQKPLTIVTPSVLDLPTGESTLALSAVGGHGEYQWSLTGGRPEGLQLSEGGLLTAKVLKPTEASIQAVVTDASNSKQTKNLTIKFRHTTSAVLRLRSRDLTTAVLGVPYRFPISADGGVGRVRVAVKGILPKGLNLLEDGVIEGTPRQTGTWPLEIELSDEKEQRLGPVQLALRVVPGVQSVPMVITDELPKGMVGIPYRAIFSADGGVGKYRWEIAGNLPPGIRKTENGFAGIPSKEATGSWTFQILVRDDAGQASVERNLVLAVEESWPQLAIETKELPPGIHQSSYVVALSASGCWRRCFWKVSGMPAGLSLTNNVLQGIPERIGNYDVQVAVSDEKKRQVTTTLKLRVGAK